MSSNNALPSIKTRVPATPIVFPLFNNVLHHVFNSQYARHKTTLNQLYFVSLRCTNAVRSHYNGHLVTLSSSKRGTGWILSQALTILTLLAALYKRHKTAVKGTLSESLQLLDSDSKTVTSNFERGNCYSSVMNITNFRCGIN